MMKVVSVILILILTLPLTIAKPQSIEVKNYSIVVERKVDTKINDSLVTIIYKEVERSEKLKYELLNVTKKEMATETEKNNKIIKILEKR